MCAEQTDWSWRSSPKCGFSCAAEQKLAFENQGWNGLWGGGGSSLCALKIWKYTYCKTIIYNVQNWKTAEQYACAAPPQNQPPKQPSAPAITLPRSHRHKPGKRLCNIGHSCLYLSPWCIWIKAWKCRMTIGTSAWASVCPRVIYAEFHQRFQVYSK